MTAFKCYMYDLEAKTFLEISDTRSGSYVPVLTVFQLIFFGKGSCNFSGGSHKVGLPG